MKFAQIDPNKPIENKDSLWISFLGAVVLALLFFVLLRVGGLSPILAALFVVPGVLVVRRVRRLFPDWTSEKDKVGSLEFTNTELLVDPTCESIPYQDIKSVLFRYNYVKGRNFSNKDVVHNGLAELSLQTQANEEFQFKFVIERVEQFEYLKTIFRLWYRQGVDIDEEFANHRLKTICLEVVGAKPYEERRRLMADLRADGEG